MKKAFFLSIVLLTTAWAQSQPLTGTKNIPGNYATIQAAIADLNTNGVGAGGVTFLVTAGHTETLSGSTAGLITATGSAGDPVVFMKNPSTAGNNPKITAFTPGTSTTLDGMIKIAGGDYITFNGIDLEENAANNTATKMMEWGYALVKKQNTAPFNGCQHVTLKNCTITLNKTNTGSVGIYSGNHIATATTTLVITARTDAHNSCSFDSNYISNVYTGIKLSGYGSPPSPYALYDHFNSIGQNGRNIITNFGGGGSATYGIYLAYQDSVVVTGDSINGGSGTTGLLAGIHLNAGTSISAEISYNQITLTRSGSGGTHLYGIWNQAGGIPASNLIDIHHNALTSLNHPTTTTGILYGIYNTGGAATVNIHDNLLDNCTYSGTANQYGIYSQASGTIHSIYGNTIQNLTNTSTGALTMIQTSSFTTTNIYQNTLQNCNATGGTVYGIYTAGGTTVNNYRNMLNGISSNNGSTASCLVYGIYNLGSSTVYLYNNYVTQLYANMATSNPAIIGFHLTGGISLKCYYNTVYLDAASSGTTFGSAAVNVGGSVPIELRNNIFVNVSTPGTTGYTIAHRRSSTTGLTNYNSASNNNCFYAGTPGPNNLIFYNTSAGDQTLEAYKTRVSPRDALSFSETPPFTQMTTLPYDLRLLTTVPTFCEGGASIVTTPSITEDYEGTPRYPNPGYPDHPTYPASAPDVGADEFGGIRNDTTAPLFTYVPLKNTSVTGNRTITVTITDAQSGVPVTLPGLPVVYWKINDAVSWNSAVAVSLGSGMYSFTFGSGAVLADVVYYYFCAQDGFITPNAGSSPSTGAAGFSINPPACSTPPVLPNAYRIVGTLPAGNYYIGGTGNTPATGCTYVDLTQAFADLNNVVDYITVTNGGSGYSPFSTYVTITGGGGSGALAEADVDAFGAVSGIRVTHNGQDYYKAPLITITGAGSGATAVAHIGAGKEITGHVNFIIDTSYNSLEENYFPVHLDDVVGSSPSKTITLKPAPLTSPTVFAFTGAAVLKLNGVDYFTIDGSNNGTNSRDMTLQHISAPSQGATVWIASASSTDGATHNTIKNCIIKGSDASSGMYACIFSGGASLVDPGSPAQNQNSDNVIENNQLFWAKNGIAIIGKSTSDPDPGVIIRNNQLGTASPGEGFTNQGIYLENQQTGLVHGNEIRNVIYSGQYYWVAGIYLNNCKSMTISANRIHDIRQSLTGASFYVDGIYQIAPAFNTTGNPSANTYVNNLVYDLSSLGESSYYNVVGIHNAKGWGDKYYYNTVYLSGQLNQTGSSNGSMSACFSNGQGVNSTFAPNIDVRNNLFYINSHNASGVNHHYAHYANLSNYTGSTLNYNLLYDSVTGTAVGHVGRFNAVNQDNLTQWQSATAQDLLSVTGDPQFTSASNFLPQPTSPAAGAGTPIAGFVTDIDGNPRDALHPTIGAFEITESYDKQWNGTISTDWGNGSNWTPTGVPSAGENVLIAAPTTFPCQISSSGKVCKNITVATGATLTLDGAGGLTVNGTMTIQTGGTLNNNGNLQLKGNLVNLN